MENRSAAATRSSICSSDRSPLSASIVMFWRCPLLFSSAQTVRMPFTSISKITLILGARAGAGAMPCISNTPSWWFSTVLARSPSNTWMRTAVWLLDAVENIFSALVGMVVLRGMSVVMTPPAVWSPRERGVTSSRTRSFMRSSMTGCCVSELSFSSPVGEGGLHSTAACTAAPAATTSSGFTEWHSSLPLKKSLSICWTLGMRVEPPTSTMSWTLSAVIWASARTALSGSTKRCRACSITSSKVARDRVYSKSLPSKRQSTWTLAESAVERSLLARSAAVRRRLMERGFSRSPSQPVSVSKTVARW
mmetsp:Transcript_34129/g.96709  ORF Transcript_34129/g.96709 Transcript_34129/m.96709 type:complete len:307 (+) Transcript_34129:453-1373(+)